ncbi:MAG TPA: hypothetical protein VK116_18070, partial [Planctomycetota bacterium]|nr:hypothetical protein [Planctomycetota bacterium]
MRHLFAQSAVRLLIVAAAIFAIGFTLEPPSVLGAAPESRPEDIAFFENEVRPLLVEHCYECHSSRAEKPRANLRLDSRAG